MPLFPRALPFVLVLMTIGIAIACELDQMHQGCRIVNAQCSCGYGCISEYRYNTLEECKLLLRGRRNDICYRKPCRHGGSCLQISQEPRFKCQCEGTGFYGARCDKVTGQGYSPPVFAFGDKIDTTFSRIQ